MLPPSHVMILGLAAFLAIVFLCGVAVGATIVWNWHRSTQLDAELEAERRRKVGA